MTGPDAVPGTAAPAAALPGNQRGRERRPAAGFAARAMADPAFLARFAAAYTGDDDPLDALWWLDHPEETGPSGAPAPVAAALAARRALYGPGTDPAALQRYERAAADAERSRSAAVAALGRLPVRADRPPLASEVAPTASPAVAAGRRRTGRMLLPAAAALVAVALAAGFWLGRVVPAPAAPASALVEHFQQTVKEQDAVAIFQRAPEPADLLGGDLQPIDTVNLRRLVTIGSVRFFAARTTGDGAALCLIAVDGGRAASRCAAQSGFARSGITLRAADGLPAGFAAVRWQPDGRLVWWSPLG